MYNIYIYIYLSIYLSIYLPAKSSTISWGVSENGKYQEYPGTLRHCLMMMTMMISVMTPMIDHWNVWPFDTQLWPQRTIGFSGGRSSDGNLRKQRKLKGSGRSCRGQISTADAGKQKVFVAMIMYDSICLCYFLTSDCHWWFGQLLNSLGGVAMDGSGWLIRRKRWNGIARRVSNDGRRSWNEGHGAVPPSCVCVCWFVKPIIAIDKIHIYHKS